MASVMTHGITPLFGGTQTEYLKKKVTALLQTFFKKKIISTSLCRKQLNLIKRHIKSKLLHCGLIQRGG